MDRIEFLFKDFPFARCLISLRKYTSIIPHELCTCRFLESSALITARSKSMWMDLEAKERKFRDVLLDNWRRFCRDQMAPAAYARGEAQGQIDPFPEMNYSFPVATVHSLCKIIICVWYAKIYTSGLLFARECNANYALKSFFIFGQYHFVLMKTEI